MITDRSDLSTRERSRPGHNRPSLVPWFLLVWGPSVLLALLAHDRLSPTATLGAPDWSTFPLATVPQGLAWLLGGHASSRVQAALLVGLMSLALGLTAQLMSLIGARLRVQRAGLAWLVIAGPLFPVVILGYDAWPLLLTTAALSAMLGRRDGNAALLQLAAVLAQGWPAILAALDWLRGKTARAGLILGASGLVAALLVNSPGFDLRLQPHTVGGGFVNLLGYLGGEPVDIGRASGAALLLQVNLALLLATLALTRLDRGASRRSHLRLLGALLLAGLVASPVLPATAVFWASPLLALYPSRTLRRTAFSVTSLTLLLVLLGGESLAGLAILNLRNLLLVGLTGMTAWKVAQPVRVARPGPVARPAMAKTYALLALSSSVVIGSWLMLAVGHLGDFYKVDHASRARMAFAQYAREGVLFPPIFDGVRFGGTRWMPAPFVIHAAASRFTGEFLVSGKILTYLSVIALVVLVATILRKKGSTWPVVGGLVSVLLVTPAALRTMLGVRWDALSIVPQLAALALVAGIPQLDRRRGDRRLLVAAVLCVLAFTAKVTAVWAAVAIVAWLALRDRRRAGLFLASYGALLVASLVGLHVLSDGRMLENFQEVSGAGFEGFLSLRRGPSRFLTYLPDRAHVLWVLLPLAVLKTVSSAKRGDLSPYELGLAIALPLTMTAMGDHGVGDNHLLDVLTLVVVVVGGIWRSELENEGSSFLPSGRILVSAVVAWSLLGSYFTLMSRDAGEALQDWARGQAVERYSPATLDDHLDSSESILSEEAYIPLRLGQVPVVADSWMFRQLKDRRHPEWDVELAERIEQQEFDKIVTVNHFDHFGERIGEAISTYYELCRVIGEFEVHAVKNSGCMAEVSSETNEKTLP